MNNKKEENRIKLSYDIPMYISIIGISISMWILIVGLSGLLNKPFDLFNLIALLFVLVTFYAIDIFIHLVKAELNDDFIYLKNFYTSKNIELSSINSVKQRWGLRKNYEPLIVIKTKSNKGIIRKFYIVPDNVSYSKKVDNRIFDLLSDKISRAKNKNNR